MVFSDALDVAAPVRYCLAGGFAVAIVVASMLQPPGTFLANPGPFDAFGVDKWVHLFSYATLAALVAYAALVRHWQALLVIIVVSVVLGAAVEAIQLTVPWRTGEAGDVVANGVGAVLGVVGWQRVSGTLRPGPVGSTPGEGSQPAPGRAWSD